MSYGSITPEPEIDWDALDRAQELEEVGEPDDTFWKSRPILEHIRNFARARRVGPWAMFSVVAAYASASTPPDVQLPALVGGAASLNTFWALVGPSGGGKGAAESAAVDGVQFQDRNGHAIAVQTHPAGSGEGIARVYRPHGTDPDEPNQETQAIFTAGEVDTLAALGGRSGSTLMPQLRHMYSGEQLGFANAGKDTRVVVGRHTYRAVLIVGVQPLKAGALLDDADGGTPQRFVWAPVGDPYAPDVRPACPEPMIVTLPEWTFGRHEMRVPDEAAAAVDANRKATLRGEQANALDGHALQCRIKVAAVLAVMDGRAHVSTSDWELSAAVMEVSADTRQACVNAIQDKARKANRARAHADAERAEIIDDTRADKAVKRVARTVVNRLSKVGGVASKSDLRRAVAGPNRGHFDPALNMLAEQGLVLVTPTDRGESVALVGQAEGWTGGSTSTPTETPSDLQGCESGSLSTLPPLRPISTEAAS